MKRMNANNNEKDFFNGGFASRTHYGVMCADDEKRNQFIRAGIVMITLLRDLVDLVVTRESKQVLSTRESMPS